VEDDAVARMGVLIPRTECLPHVRKVSYAALPNEGALRVASLSGTWSLTFTGGLLSGFVPAEAGKRTSPLVRRGTRCSICAVFRVRQRARAESISNRAPEGHRVIRTSREAPVSDWPIFCCFAITRVVSNDGRERTVSVSDSG